METADREIEKNSKEILSRLHLEREPVGVPRRGCCSSQKNPGIRTEFVRVW